MTNEKKKKSKLASKILLTILILAVFVGAVLYMAGAMYYSNRFFEGTVINGVNCAKMTVDEVKDVLQEKIEEYSIILKLADNKAELITASDLGMLYEDDGKVDELINAQNKWKWFMAFVKSEKYEVSANRTYKENMVDVLLWEKDSLKEENQIYPQDAYLKDCGTYYEIVPEVIGRAIDTTAVRALVIEAIAEGKEEVDLTGCYLKPSVYQDDAELNSDMTQLNALLSTKITYDFDDRQELVDAAVIKEWLYEDNDGTWKVNEEKAADFVQSLKYKYDTFGQTREFVTSLGKTVTLKGGDYGWVIKKQQTTDALIKAIMEGKEETIEPVYLYKGTCRATNDIGGTYIEVSIEDQRMWCYKNGELVVDTPVVTGTATKEDRATPAGSVWAIDGKVSPWVLRGQGYAEKVTFWLPFNGNVGVHDATWRSEFGGDIYLTSGSHGCINTPYENAEKVYHAVEIGHPVIVY